LPDEAVREDLHRGLKERHVQMIAIGGAIGVGLFLGSAKGSSYADEFVGPWAGFATAWTYWLMWVVIAMAEVTAAGIYMQYWFPALPQWIPALVALVGLLAANLIAVGKFGEFEFWCAISRC
jgi:amino acid transporter, AAT family